jgi:HAMP domain-containing protein/HPt (histidine-containing phosphotransfer) domain-containing protein
MSRLLRMTSLGTKLALATVGVLSVISILLYLQLTSREQQHLLSSKTTAAGMVTNLFAASLAAPLDFGDADAMETELGNLRTNPEIIQAWIWSQGADDPITRLHREASLAEAPPPKRLDFGTRVLADRVEVARPVIGRSGKPLGRVSVVFSLAAENATFVANRTRIFWWTLLMVVATAFGLILIARIQIIRPLAKVADGARRLARGELAARVDIDSADEVGQLARAFNTMGEAIADREQRLDAARQSLRDLFDHMQQAIVAFGPNGTIEGEISKQAARLFGGELAGVRMRDVLYRGAPDGDIDAQAFEEWANVAFSMLPAEWAEFAALAPAEVVLRTTEGQPVPLELEFRPVTKNGKIVRVMVLASDVSEQRALERAVQSQEAEHARQMAAMRRLVAGGPQVFVMFVDSARQRIARCLEIIGPAPRMLLSGEIDELFRHVHTLKGEASAFDLRDLATQSAELEEELDELRSEARGEGFATTTSVHGRLAEHFARATEALERGCEIFVAASPTGRVALDQVTVQRSDLLELQVHLGHRTDVLGQIAARLASRPFGESTANLVDLVPTWADKEGKRARLQVEGKEARVPAHLARILGGALTHLIRNAIVHGVEIPGAREGKGKPAIGLIRVVAAEGDGGPIITVEDDGQGLDLASIAQQAMAIGETVGSRPIEQLAFLPGLSTARMGDLAGRGVGLHAVKSEMEAVGYKVDVFSKAGEYARFVLRPKDGPCDGNAFASKEARQHA